GKHALDLFGPQMSSMSRYLRSENDIKDVVAYINTLPLQDLETHSRVKTEFMPSPVAGGL
ncbi:MAG: hypothetical protein ACI8VR_001728, partial [Candidatus Azotimanducaceae bacterium]